VKACMTALENLSPMQLCAQHHIGAELVHCGLLDCMEDWKLARKQI